jgi:hypothetical protein
MCRPTASNQNPPGLPWRSLGFSLHTPPRKNHPSPRDCGDEAAAVVRGRFCGRGRAVAWVARGVNLHRASLWHPASSAARRCRGGQRMALPVLSLAPRRSLPPSSDVQNQNRIPRDASVATTLLASVEWCSKAEGHGCPSLVTRRVAWNTAPPGRARRWRGGETQPHRSGAEHGSTATSAVVAL